MTNEERMSLLIAAGTRLDKASADLTSTDKLPARMKLREVIRSVLTGTDAEEFIEELIAVHARNGQAFDFQAFNFFVGLVAAAQDESLSNVFVYCKTAEMLAI
ncbi:hypothetical protein [Pseudomonas lini]|uniref:hypothetical protein n=1 Tax=Pseudomonas lini TaxID=163011 RepID=UPI000682C6D8|nr:hypothetical protein [Pseudomonas lini]KNH48361.1 hypothetical protein ACS73_00370 [Pseudomonas lini]